MFLCKYDGFCLRQVDPDYFDGQRPERYEGKACLSSCECFDDCGMCKHREIASFLCDPCRREQRRKVKEAALMADSLMLIGKLRL